jgi:hypothetical protein
VIGDVMPPSIGFVAYGSAPETVGETVEAALRTYAGLQASGRFASWRENDIAGRFLAEPILDNIAQSQCLVADITTLNFNVTFEVGYSIGIGKRVILVKNKAIKVDETELRRVGIFDTLGYLTYTNSDELYRILFEIKNFDPLDLAAQLNVGAPVYVLQLPFNTDAQGRIIARIKKTRLRYRSFDPSEQIRLAAPDAIENVAASYGVVVPLAPKTMVDASIHNLRAAFVAGLAHGMKKVLVLIQSDEDPVPLDYRDLVQSYRHPRQLDDIIERFALDVTDALQARTRTTHPKHGLLASLDMGSSTAENEFVTLGEYYVQTDEFRRSLRGEARIVVGRKGAGKTAVFAQVRDHIRSDQKQIVLDLKPEGYQLLKFKEQVLDLLEEGTREHTITAFWEYLLLLEVSYKILEKDRSVHLRDHELYEPYQALARVYKEDTYSQEGDFSERMLHLVEQIADAFKEKHPQAAKMRLTRQQVTEFIYAHDIHELRSQVEEYLKLKKGLWILFDNLDKGWPAHGIGPEDLLIIRSLLDATRKIEQALQSESTDCHTIVFLRNDVYSLLVDTTPDRGKEIRVSLDWSEPDLLRELVRRRLIYSGLQQKASFDQLWSTICVSLIDGEASCQYLIDRSMMRPRFLLNLISHCRGYAVNLGHDRIEPDDIRKGLDAFSTDLIYDIDLEIRDVLPFAVDVLYTFFGQNARLDVGGVTMLLGNRYGSDDAAKIVHVLLWYGVLGVVREDEEPAFIYSVNYDIRRLIAVLDSLPVDRRRFYVNPAFWPGLEIKDLPQLL